MARKDTVILGPNDEVEVAFIFQGYGGPFTFHCHNLHLEDMAVMARFDTVLVEGSYDPSPFFDLRSNTVKSGAIHAAS